MVSGKKMQVRQIRGAQPVAWSPAEKRDVLRDIKRNPLSATPYVVRQAKQKGKTYTAFHHKKQMG